MPSHPTEYPRASAALAGLGFTTQIAAAAPCGNTIATLALGAVARIVTLAQEIEKNREALHELAESARQMGPKITAVVSGRQLGPEMERSLEAIYEVLRSIETLFKKHKAKHWFRRALSYALTTAKRIDGLRQELSRAAEDFLLVAAIDTNIRVQETSQYIQESSQYTGMFRNLHDCDVDKLELIVEDAAPWRRYGVKYYTARVEKSGPVLVLRYLECNARFTSEEHLDIEDKLFLQRVFDHDKLLEKLSTVRHSHRNIARIYGVGQGDPLIRFTVMKSGYIPLSMHEQSAPSVDRAWDIIRQLVNALCYLRDNGLTWHPDLDNPFFLDTANVPIIGWNNDLITLESYGVDGGCLFVFGRLLEHAYSGLWGQLGPGELDLDICFGDPSVARTIWTDRSTIPRRLIPTLDEKISTFLKHVLDCPGGGSSWWARTGIIIMIRATYGCNICPAFYTEYVADTSFFRPLFPDSVYMARLEEVDDQLVLRRASASIQPWMAEGLRKRLGIPWHKDSARFQIWSSTRDSTDPSSLRFDRWRRRWW